MQTQMISFFIKYYTLLLYTKCQKSILLFSDQTTANDVHKTYGFIQSGKLLHYSVSRASQCDSSC